MASGGQALAQVSGTDTVQVTLAVEVAKSITLQLAGDAELTGNENINEDFTGFPLRTIQVKKGFTTGCLTLQGVENITVKVTGENNVPGNPEPFLRGQGAASDVYLSYYPVLAINVVGTNSFEDMFTLSRTNQPSNFWYYSNYVDNGGAGNHTNGATNNLFNAPSKLGPSPCDLTYPNIAFGAMVGVDNPIGSLANGTNRVYGAINQLLDEETGLVAGTYNFTDTVTVLITPSI
jgi:hypothetical protein